MNLDDIFEGGIGDEFRVTYFQYSDMYLAGPPETSIYTLCEIHPKGVYLTRDFKKVIFIPFERIGEVTKVL
jgi:hypothetical protein